MSSLPHGRRYRRAAMIGGLIVALASTIALPPRPWLVWNVSASAPTGLYLVGGRDDIARGDMVIVWMPQPWRNLAATRRYLPANIPLVKRVAAAPGDTVCAAHEQIHVNGRWAAWRRPFDGRGRPLRAWHGCVTLGEGALFLLIDARGSFDGRYFGPTSAQDIVGRATLLWAL